MIGGRWATDMNLRNTTDTPITGRIDLFANNGAPLPATLIGATKSTFTYWIPPRESLVLTPFGTH